MKDELRDFLSSGAGYETMSLLGSAVMNSTGYVLAAGQADNHVFAQRVEKFVLIVSEWNYLMINLIPALGKEFCNEIFVNKL